MAKHQGAGHYYSINLTRRFLKFFMFSRINFPRINFSSTTPAASSDTGSSSREPLLAPSGHAESSSTGLPPGLSSRRSILFSTSSIALNQACNAAKSGDLNKLQKLLKENHSLFTETDKKGNNLLALSVQNAESIRALLFLTSLSCPDQLAPIVNQRNHDGNTVLALALQSGNLESAKLLLKERSIDLELVNNKDQTVLHLAASTTPEIVAQILQHPAAQTCLTKILNCRDRGGITALSAAVHSGKPEITEILLQQPDIDVNLADNDQRTPLHIAASWKALLSGSGAAKEKLLKLLLNHSAIQPNLPDKFGDTPLHACTKHVSIAEKTLNIEIGWASVPILAESPKVDPNLRNINGRTLLELALERYSEANLDNQQDILHAITSLLKNAIIDPNLHAHGRPAPLWQAVGFAQRGFGMSDSGNSERYIAPLMRLATSPKIDFHARHEGRTIIEHLRALQPPSGWVSTAQGLWKKHRNELVEKLQSMPNFGAYTSTAMDFPGLR